jgi:hypothetical protein
VIHADEFFDYTYPIITLWGSEIDICFIAWRSYVVVPIEETISEETSGKEQVWKRA